MALIAALADRYGFAVVEDASHAIGGYYQGEPVGSCSHSKITVFSFHPVKIITTGEGGLAATSPPRATHGGFAQPWHYQDAQRFEQPAPGPWATNSRSSASTIG